MKILVTGGCGFVSRHLVKRLSRDKRNRITAVDDLSTGLKPKDWPKHLQCNVKDFFDADCVDYFGKAEERFDVVFHLAAVVEGRLTIENDPLKVAKDLMIDSMLFRWAARTKPLKIVYFSSSAVYPVRLQQRDSHVPLKEEFVDLKAGIVDIPDLSYGWSKLTGEYLSTLAVKNYGLKIAIYRPFSGYGEDQPLTYPLPAILKRVIDKELPIKVWGDGEQSRDFIYIEDCIDGILNTYERIDDASTLNLGTGKPTTFRSLVKTACAVNGIECATLPQTDKPVGVFARYCDRTKQDAFGIRPKVTLEEGIGIVADYLKKNPPHGA